jgi:cell shape-determining protein MreD
MSLLLLIVALYFHTLGIFYNNIWQYTQPFLLVLLLFYFNCQDVRIAYLLAFVAGLYLDSLSAIFGLYTFLFIFIIFILRSLQLTWLTSKNIFTILSLAFLAYFIFWLAFWFLNFIFAWQIYFFSWSILLQISKASLISILILKGLSLIFFKPNIIIKNVQEY